MKRLIIILLAFLALDLVGVIIYYRLVVDFIENKAPPSKADAIIVFEGGFDWDTVKLTPETLKRLNSAIELCKDGLASNIICVGGIRKRPTEIQHLIYARIFTTTRYS